MVKYFIMTVLMLVLSLNSSAATVAKFILTEDQRADINLQRESYINSLKNKSTSKETVVLGIRTKNKTKKKVRKVSKKISVSSIIVSPHNGKLVRINGKFVSENLKEIKLIQDQTSGNSAKLIINGKSIIVPVGKSYLTNSQKVVDIYK